MPDRRHPAVSVVVAYLGSMLDVPVSSRVPVDRPDSFVRVSRVGGLKTNIVTDGPMIKCECWHPVSAESLAMRVMDLLEDLPPSFVDYRDDDGNPQRAWVSTFTEIGAPAELPDPDVSTQDRWILTVALGIATNV